MKQDISLKEFIRLIVDALGAARVDYLLGGAVGVWVWGEFRATADVDVVVDLPLEAVERLSDELKKRGMLVPPDIIRDLIAETRADLAINAIHPFSGYKAELFPLRPGDELRQAALRRRQLADLGAEIGEVYVHSPEDLILYKLRYYAVSRRTKHARDIASILASDHELDKAYLKMWIERLGLGAVWAEIAKE